MEDPGHKKTFQIDLAKLKSGNKKAFEDLFEHFYVPLVDYAWRLLHDKEIAKEIVQEIFCQLWEKHSELEITISLQAYLYKTTYTKSLNTIRHQKIIQKYMDHALLDLYFQEILQTPEAESQLFNQDTGRYIAQALEQLPPRCREIFTLSKMQHLSNEQIACRLNISLKTVANQLSLSLSLLRKELEWLLVFIVIIHKF